jgi:hypothetical protein
LCAVGEPTDPDLEYNHIAVYNTDKNAWGALDVVKPSNEFALLSHQFYDTDVGWLAPRIYKTESP